MSEVKHLDAPVPLDRAASIGSRALFDPSKYKDPVDALNRASIGEWAEACAHMLVVTLGQRAGAPRAFIEGGFETFLPIARKMFSGHGFKDQHYRHIYHAAVMRLGGTPCPELKPR